MGFTWSDFGSSEQRKRHVKPNPDRQRNKSNTSSRPNRLVPVHNQYYIELSDMSNDWPGTT
ncbi:hypothetical protein [Kroppenstedtia eburnea]|uniref:hypothetical protein n=1 Tax=Kroppenstedtia eburnea TaxID=714067 RepID=UPI00097122F6|nr:hypothetical protein [Kroppenstedtia eburnea]